MANMACTQLTFDPKAESPMRLPIVVRGLETLKFGCLTKQFHCIKYVKQKGYWVNMTDTHITRWLYCNKQGEWFVPSPHLYDWLKHPRHFLTPRSLTKDELTQILRQCDQTPLSDENGKPVYRFVPTTPEERARVSISSPPDSGYASQETSPHRQTHFSPLDMPSNVGSNVPQNPWPHASNMGMGMQMPPPHPAPEDLAASIAAAGVFSPQQAMDFVAEFGSQQNDAMNTASNGWFADWSSNNPTGMAQGNMPTLSANQPPGSQGFAPNAVGLQGPIPQSWQPNVPPMGGPAPPPPAGNGVWMNVHSNGMVNLIMVNQSAPFSPNGGIGVSQNQMANMPVINQPGPFPHNGAMGMNIPQNQMEGMPMTGPPTPFPPQGQTGMHVPQNQMASMPVMKQLAPPPAGKEMNVPQNQMAAMPRMGAPARMDAPQNQRVNMPVMNRPATLAPHGGPGMRMNVPPNHPTTMPTMQQQVARPPHNSMGTNRSQNPRAPSPTMSLQTSAQLLQNGSQGRPPNPIPPTKALAQLAQQAASPLASGQQNRIHPKPQTFEDFVDESKPWPEKYGG